jgi:hypothetical protein
VILRDIRSRKWQYQFQHRGTAFLYFAGDSLNRQMITFDGIKFKFPHDALNVHTAKFPGPIPFQRPFPSLLIIIRPLKSWNARQIFSIA